MTGAPMVDCHFCGNEIERALSVIDLDCRHWHPKCFDLWLAIIEEDEEVGAHMADADPKQFLNSIFSRSLWLGTEVVYGDPRWPSYSVWMPHA